MPAATLEVLICEVFIDFLFIIAITCTLFTASLWVLLWVRKTRRLAQQTSFTFTSQHLCICCRNCEEECLLASSGWA